MCNKALLGKRRSLQGGVSRVQQLTEVSLPEAEEIQVSCTLKQ